MPFNCTTLTPGLDDKRRWLGFPGPPAHLVVGLLQAGDGVAPHGGVGEGGGEQLQGVLHVHGPPLAQQLQGLLGLLGQVPVHTLQELGQGLEGSE